MYYVFIYLLFESHIKMSYKVDHAFIIIFFYYFQNHQKIIKVKLFIFILCIYLYIFQKLM